METNMQILNRKAVYNITTLYLEEFIEHCQGMLASIPSPQPTPTDQTSPQQPEIYTPENRIFGMKSYHEMVKDDFPTFLYRMAYIYLVAQFDAYLTDVFEIVIVITSATIIRTQTEAYGI